MKIISGNSWINYENPFPKVTLRGLVLSELIDSDLSYEKPALINSPLELRALFGKDFTEYEYLCSFLESGEATLYLYRPVLGEITTGVANGFYFLEDVSPQTELTLSLLKDKENLLSSKNLLNKQVRNPRILYKVLTKTGPHADRESSALFTYYRFNEFLEDFAEEFDIPTTNNSITNRDKLSVGENGAYCYYPLLDDPVVEKEDRNIVDITYITDKYGSFDTFNSKILKPSISKNLVLYFNDMKDEELKLVRFVEPYFNEMENIACRTSYFAIPRLVSSGGYSNLVYDYYIYRPEDFDIPNSRIYCANDEFTGNVEPLSNSGNTYYFSSVNELKLYFDSDSDGLIHIKLDSEIPMILPVNMPESFYYMIDDLEDQKDIYTEWIQPCELYRFESKTIGTGGLDGSIEVILEKSDLYQDIYTLTVTRFDYEESYMGTLTTVPGTERLDDLVSRKSKLIRFNILVDEVPENGWIVGNWKLLGARYENYDEWDYQQSLDTLTNNNDFTDFFLFRKKEGLSDYQMLNAAEKCNCQALVVNDGNNLDTNLVSDDPDNRLMYFFGDFFYKDYNGWRPGYDIFLKGLIRNNYLPETSDIIYPVLTNELKEEDKDADLGVKYKSNVLSFNEYNYFYDMYYPGEDPNTFPLVRFVISKISRDLERWKWEVIGEKLNNPKIRTSFEQALTKIANSFTIIRSIQVVSFKLNELTQTIQANILTKMSDLISSDVSFDIILNYNKNQT